MDDIMSSPELLDDGILTQEDDILLQVVDLTSSLQILLWLTRMNTLDDT